MTWLVPLFQGNKQAHAINNAASTQVAQDQKAIDENARQFDETQANLKPWLDAGKTALGGQLDLAGLSGGAPQQAAIDQLKASPLYQSLYRNGVDTINANASATGGLRGGNIQRSLANFGSDSLSSVIQSQLATLGGISGAGQTTGTNLGQLGANSATTIGNLYVGQGQDKAGGILGSSQARIAGQNESLKQLTDAVAQLAKGGGF